MLWCRDVLFSFQFWDGKQNLVQNMWQVVFANVLIEGRVVDSDVNGFFDGSGHTISLYINHLCTITSVPKMFITTNKHNNICAR